MKTILLALAVMFVGCGGAPSSFDLCHQGCDALRKCGIYTDAQATNCHTQDCDAKRGTLNDQDAMYDKNCRNGGDVRSRLGNCYGMECNKIISCTQTVDTTCIQK
jgi:hypothetical protein